MVDDDDRRGGIPASRATSSQILPEIMTRSGVTMNGGGPYFLTALANRRRWAGL